jgi:hypothetical protein
MVTKAFRLFVQVPSVILASDHHARSMLLTRQSCFDAAVMAGSPAAIQPRRQNIHIRALPPTIIVMSDHLTRQALQDNSSVNAENEICLTSGSPLLLGRCHAAVAAAPDGDK